jgi:hypothetical protein
MYRIIGLQIMNNKKIVAIIKLLYECKNLLNIKDCLRTNFNSNLIANFKTLTTV